MPFPTKKFQQETPLHLAAEAALGKLIKVFLEHGGNPNSANGREETCLHSICHHPDNAAMRLEVMNNLLLWRSADVEDGEEPESVSINHVDIDGNAAVHYASSNGLTECVEKLISLGAIISIVNKAQRTCCELADTEGYPELAGALELALVFQPVDSSMEAFDQTEFLYYQNQSRHALLALDCESMKQEEVSAVINEMLAEFCSFSGESLNRAESLLESCSWDLIKLKKEFQKSSSDVYKLAQIEPMCVPCFSTDPSPLIPNNEKEKEILPERHHANIEINMNPKNIEMESHETDLSVDSLKLDFEEANCKISSEENLATTKEDSRAESNLLDNPVFVPSPCSICQEIMLQPVTAAAALKARKAPMSSMSGEGSLHGVDVEVVTGWGSISDPTGLSSCSSGSATASSYSKVHNGDISSESAIGATVGYSSSITGIPSEKTTATAIENISGKEKVVGEAPYVISLTNPADLDPDLEQRGLQCQSGHIFCVACWSAYASLQVRVCVIDTVCCVVLSYVVRLCSGDCCSHCIKSLSLSRAVIDNWCCLCHTSSILFRYDSELTVVDLV
jgi:Ankyrin repeat